MADRAKPGLIAVNKFGEHFIDEAENDHDFVRAMLGRLKYEDQQRSSDLRYDVYPEICVRRYSTRFECRDGEWKIVHRVTTGDWDRIDEVTARMEGDLVHKPKHGTRDCDDPSYAYFRADI